MRPPEVMTTWNENRIWWVIAVGSLRRHADRPNYFADLAASSGLDQASLQGVVHVAVATVTQFVVVHNLWITMWRRVTMPMGRAGQDGGIKADGMGIDRP